MSFTNLIETHGRSAAWYASCFLRDKSHRTGMQFNRMRLPIADPTSASKTRDHMTSAVWVLR